MNWEAIGAVGEVGGAAAVVATFTNWETSYYEYRRGSIEDEVWDARKQRIHAFFRDRAAARTFWRTIQADRILGRSFAEFVEREVLTSLGG